ncbi:unnamed protein product [Allacma fusca]|uniref:Uncharacterized protein n=1 Tax=Allacma fusca TaxID=39272 RepID=A0A8J2JUT7_9HEXA|nr:unnamed protein product [Allacma fusca]
MFWVEALMIPINQSSSNVQGFTVHDNIKFGLGLQVRPSIFYRSTLLHSTSVCVGLCRRAKTSLTPTSPLALQMPNGHFIWQPK